jgi:hypothetical protein
MSYYVPTIQDWAKAIATRISDEWVNSEDFSEDAGLLREIIYRLLLKSPKLTSSLIGTGIIEEDYFDTLD